MTDTAARARHTREAVLLWASESVPVNQWANIGQIFASPRMRFDGTSLTWDEVFEAKRHLQTWGLLEEPDANASRGIPTARSLVRLTANGSRLVETGGSVEAYLDAGARTVKSDSVALPGAATVHALGMFIQARAEEGTQTLLRRIPAEQHDTPDAIELLRIPLSLGRAAEAAADQLEGQLLAYQPDLAVAQTLWRILLDIARPFRDHPELPVGVREALVATDEA